MHAEGMRLAHEIGHLLGLEDETQEKCDCDTALGTCVMQKGDADKRTFLWSTCSVNQLRHRRGSSDSCRPSSSRLIVLRVFVVLLAVLLLSFGLWIGFSVGLHQRIASAWHQR